MIEGIIFQILFVLLWIIFLGIRGYYGHKAQPVEQKRTRQTRWAESTRYEAPLVVLLRIAIMVILVIFIGVYALVPFMINWAYLPIPSVIRWVGVGVAFITLPFLLWVGQSLGRHVSGQLELRKEHALVTSGPYSRVRHPMYTVYLVFNVAMLLLCANWILMGIILAGLFLLYWRIKAEEDMLLEEFGEDYQKYKQHTGLLLPRLRRRQTENHLEVKGS